MKTYYCYGHLLTAAARDLMYIGIIQLSELRSLAHFWSYSRESICSITRSTPPKT